ncbi:MAG: oxygen-dependent coproporphyrinogen oxidase [Gemmatimonadetes bacterium]|nr:oxygen-dependent coproporphyrinogen oxidase [Gemmatimonadota bacterium]
MRGAAGGTRARATAWAEEVHDFLTALFERLDGVARFREDRWDRDGGGGGNSRVMTDGAVFEKAGINRSIVMGTLPAQAAQRLGGRGAAAGSTDFFAAGVSLVVHPRSPRVPTVHLNVRYFELTDANGVRTDHWFGGGTDLTPTYPHAADAVHFHRALKQICDRHHAGFFGRFKPWCDEYFTIPHRGGEARGVGGVFFDHLRPDEDASGLDEDAMFGFATDIGHSLATAYGPIVERRKAEPTNERERHFQLWRRGRYVEFNLVYDRGTHFGLHTNARVESVLMSLPPLAAWDYAPVWEPGSFEAELVAMLKPREWVEG